MKKKKKRHPLIKTKTKKQESKGIAKKCKHCILHDKEKGICKVAFIVNGEQVNMPVFPEDNCHMLELGLPVEQIRWWVEDPITGQPTDGDGVVKMEYPEGFFK